MRRRASMGLAIGFAALTGCRADVARELGAEASEEVVLALDEAGIAAERLPSAGGGDRFDVYVERDSVVPAMARMRELGLPRDPEPGLGDESGRLLPSVVEESMRRDAALAEELRRSLEQLAGVERARVHIARDPMPRALDASPAPVRASILLMRGDSSPREDRVRALAVGAVDGLTTEDVTVVVEPLPPAARRGEAFVFVGPIAVSRASAPLLRGALASALCLNLVLVGALVLQRRRARA